MNRMPRLRCKKHLCFMMISLFIISSTGCTFKGNAPNLHPGSDPDPTTTLESTILPTATLPNADQSYDVFADLKLDNLKGENYLLFLEPVNDPGGYFQSQLNIMDQTGNDLGPLVRFSGDFVRSISSSVDGSSIAVIENEQIQLYDLINQNKSNISLPRNESFCEDIGISANGDLLATGCGNSMYISEKPFETWVKIAENSTDFVGYFSFSFSPDGNWLFSIIPAGGQSESETTGAYITDLACVRAHVVCEDSTSLLLSRKASPFETSAAAWSIDSQNLVFIMGEYRAVAMNINRPGELQNLDIPQNMSTFDLHEISWSPTDDAIAYRYENDIFVYSIRNGDVKGIREDVTSLVSWIQR